MQRRPLADQSDEDPVGSGPGEKSAGEGLSRGTATKEYGNLPQLYAAVEGEEGKELVASAYCRPSVSIES